MTTLNHVPSSVNASQSSVDREKTAKFIAQLGGLAAADRFLDCGEGGRGWVGVCPSGHEVYHSFRCMLRICPHCAAAASHKLAEKLTPAIQSLVASSSAKLGLKHITLTTNISLLDYIKFSDGRLLQKPLDDLRLLMLDLRRGAAQMMRDEFKDVEGCGWAIGIEFGANLMLHFHVLALVPFWNQKDLSTKWKLYSFGRGFIVDIREAARELSGIEKAVGYVSKYVTKPLGKKQGDETSSSRVARFVEAHGQECVMAALWYLFKGTRRFQTYGSFYALELPPEECEACASCGAALHWVSEMDYLKEGGVWAFLNSLKTNKSIFDDGHSPPKIIQIGFAGWSADVDFWK